MPPAPPRLRRPIPWAVVALAVSMAFVATAAAAGGGAIRLQVGSILARDAGAHFDQRLARLRGKLEDVFRFGSYRLVREETRGARLREISAFEIPGGHRLQVRPLEFRDEGVALHLALLRGRQVLVETDCVLGREGRVFLGGPTLEDGVLLIWVEARAAPPAGEAGAWEGGP